VRPAVASVPGARGASGRFAISGAGARSAGATPAGNFAAAEPEAAAAGASATDVPSTFTATLSSTEGPAASRIVRTPQNATTRMPKNARPSFFSLLMSVALP
jgi:hypothetical protein